MESGVLVAEVAWPLAAGLGSSRFGHLRPVFLLSFGKLALGYNGYHLTPGIGNFIWHPSDPVRGEVDSKFISLVALGGGGNSARPEMAVV